MFNKKKNKETDPVKEKQKIVNESIKNAKKEKKRQRKNNRRLIDLILKRRFLLHMMKKKICLRILMETIS